MPRRVAAAANPSPREPDETTDRLCPGKSGMAGIAAWRKAAPSAGPIAPPASFLAPRSKGSLPFRLLLDDGNGINGIRLDRFLAGQEAAGKPGEMKLTCLGGQKAALSVPRHQTLPRGAELFCLAIVRRPGPRLRPKPPSGRAPRNPPARRPPPFSTRWRCPFALTNADWPALVVDKAGAIIRSNPAAARVFGAAARKGALLGAIWAADNAPALETFLAEPAQERRPAGQVAGGKRRDHFLFKRKPVRRRKANGCCCSSSRRAPRGRAAAPPAVPSAAAPVKIEGDFLLQEADWPAFLVRKDGQVLRANRAAVRAFGSAIRKAGRQAGNASGRRKTGSRWSNSSVCRRRATAAAPQIPAQERTAGDFSGPGDLSGAGRGLSAPIAQGAGAAPRPRRVAPPARRRRRPPPPSGKNWIARCNWRAPSRWISTTP